MADGAGVTRLRTPAVEIHSAPFCMVVSEHEVHDARESQVDIRGTGELGCMLVLRIRHQLVQSELPWSTL